MQGPAEAGFELVIHFDEWVRRVPLQGRSVVLGRGQDCDVQLLDPGVSRHHCRIWAEPGGEWYVEDLGSQAGTLLGGVRLGGPLPLRPGAVLQLGPMRLRLEARPGLPALLSGDPVRDARNVDVLLRTVEDLSATEDQDELLRTIVDRAVALAGGDRGGLLLAGPGGHLEAGVARDAAGGDLPPEQALTRSLPDRALRSRRAVVLLDTEMGDPDEDLPASVRDSEIRTVLCVPLPHADGPLGVLYVDGLSPARDFGSTELAVFEALATHGALALERAKSRRRLEAENATLRAQLGADVPIGQSEPMLASLDLIRRVATADVTVCLVGETGTGKEVLARYLHRLSQRSGGPFVVVDCGAIPEGLIESELFGHEKGAFTGAAEARKGRFREADGGTVFLDEIAELPLALQSRLLRVLQERNVQPVGGAGPVPVNVRIVCATHRDLARQVAENRFRQDLYYRISVLTVPVPPLRERGEDVLLLAQHFLARFGALYGMGVSGFTREARDALEAHSWPGNVRELENRVQRAALLARPPYATRPDLGLGPSGEAPAEAPAGEELPHPTLQDARARSVEHLERRYVEETLRRSGGNVSRAAEMAGISRQLFHRLMRRYGVERRLPEVEERQS